jgi:hypothetical protein
VSKAELGPLCGCLQHIEAIKVLISNTYAIVTTDIAPRMLSKFEPFQRLPSELRHEIWTLALPSFASSVKILIGVYSYDKAKRGIPPLLHCCHESRAVALNYYKLGFEVKS